MKRGIEISFENDGKKNYYINGIENRIEQIIANLLDNAISFSEDNKNIIVKVSQSEDKKLTLMFWMKEMDLRRKIQIKFSRDFIVIGQINSANILV